eukprot:225509-Heterocapsa_arctica.AAC.1
MDLNVASGDQEENMACALTEEECDIKDSEALGQSYAVPEIDSTKTPALGWSYAVPEIGSGKTPLCKTCVAHPNRFEARAHDDDILDDGDDTNTSNYHDYHDQFDIN